jgi:DNA-binding NarL/FixJ family response regulator
MALALTSDDFVRLEAASRALLSPLGPGEALLVTVAAATAPALPTPDEVRGRLGLTKREAEVALLLAEGLKNDAIAARLFISPNTARHHTEGVMGKLGLTSRAAVGPALLARG